MPRRKQEEETVNIQTVEDAISVSEKINNALQEVRGMEHHDKEMDTIAQQAGMLWADEGAFRLTNILLE